VKNISKDADSRAKGLLNVPPEEERILICKWKNKEIKRGYLPECFIWEISAKKYFQRPVEY
jgi:hypothetical protein